MAGLSFRNCTQCHERHALRADGLMSIHTIASGARCEEPDTARSAETNLKAKAKTKRPPTAKLRDTELEAAFSVAAERKRRGSRDPKPPTSVTYNALGTYWKHRITSVSGRQ